MTGFLKRWAILNDYLLRPATSSPTSVTTKEMVSFGEPLICPRLAPQRYTDGRASTMGCAAHGVVMGGDQARGGIAAIAEHSERALIATASQDRTLKLWRWRD